MDKQMKDWKIESVPKSETQINININCLLLDKSRVEESACL